MKEKLGNGGIGMEGIIHIAGAMPRIGTTTAAIQLVAFLKRYGYNAAFVTEQFFAGKYFIGFHATYQNRSTAV